MVTGLPLTVEDVHGREYELNPNNAHSGGQGVMFSYEDKLAIKILFSSDNGTNTQTIATDEKQYAKYQRSLIHIMAMPYIEHLSLPIASLKSPYCGYVMQFMTGQMPLSELLKYEPPQEGGYIATLRKNGGLKKRLLILRNLAGILRNIHNSGLVYCDLTPSNVFISQLPTQSETWLIDVDNLEYSRNITTSWQTPWYRAPELYLGKNNSAEADCYSFALIAYEVLTFAKPFNGDAYRNLEEDVGWDEEDNWDSPSPQSMESKAQQAAESGELSYVGEPETDNTRAAGVPLRLVATEELQKLFLQTFGRTGRTNPTSRPTMNEWWRAFDRACALVVACPNGHWHINNKCFLCEQDSDHERYFRVFIHQVNYYATTREVEGEEGQIDSISSQKIPIHEIWFSRHLSLQKKNTVLSFEILWKYFPESAIKHNPETTAFILRFNGNVLSYGDCYDSNIKLKEMKKSIVPTIRVIWNNRFEYEITLEEVK